MTRYSGLALALWSPVSLMLAVSLHRVHVISFGTYYSIAVFCGEFVYLSDCIAASSILKFAVMLDVATLPPRFRSKAHHPSENTAYLTKNLLLKSNGARASHGFHHGHNTAFPTDFPTGEDTRSAGGAADVPTDFQRSAADWWQGVHSERGKGETRATQVAPNRAERSSACTNSGLGIKARKKKETVERPSPSFFRSATRAATEAISLRSGRRRASCTSCAGGGAPFRRPARRSCRRGSPCRGTVPRG